MASGEDAIRQQPQTKKKKNNHPLGGQSSMTKDPRIKVLLKVPQYLKGLV